MLRRLRVARWLAWMRLRLVIVLPRLLTVFEGGCCCLILTLLHQRCRQALWPLRRPLCCGTTGRLVGAGCLLAWIPKSAKSACQLSLVHMDIFGCVPFAGVDPREYSRQYEAKLRQAEVASIQARLFFN